MKTVDIVWDVKHIHLHQCYKLHKTMNKKVSMFESDSLSLISGYDEAGFSAFH